MTNVYGFHAKNINGADVSLADHRGKVLLVVNVASRCGLTPQYEKLEALHRRYGGRGLEVLGFPCNQFGAQEPGTEDEIKTFCTTKYDVTFPMFAKVDVNGSSAHPLFAFLTAQPTQPEGAGKISWNFGKFLIGRDGEVLARFAPTEEPMGPAMTRAIESALG